jgi:hypothetical protein
MPFPGQCQQSWRSVPYLCWGSGLSLNHQLLLMSFKDLFADSSLDKMTRILQKQIKFILCSVYPHPKRFNEELMAESGFPEEIHVW